MSHYSAQITKKHNMVQMLKKQKHEKVVSRILDEIFSGLLKPGTKLPTEVQLSKQMGVDRTTLRVGLKQLESMHLLEIIQGDGVYVKDYIKTAGLDSLRMHILMQDQMDPRLVIDEFLFEDLWKFWTSVVPEIMKLSSGKSSPRDMKIRLALFEQAEESINDLDKLVEIEMKQQEYIVNLVNNTVLSLFFNSVYPLLKKMWEIIVDSVSKEDLEKYFKMKKFLFLQYVYDQKEITPEGIENYKRQLSIFFQKIKESYRHRR